MKLIKPIVFFDIEATGLNTVHDRIVQIALLKIHPNGEENTISYTINPGIPIPKEVIDIHGITNEMVKDCPTFKTVANAIFEFIGDADLGGFNLLKFDVPMLMEEFIRVDIDFDIESRNIIDVQAIFHKMEQRTLTAAYKFYCDKELVNAHNAEVDNKATYEVFMAQIKRYQELTTDLKGIVEFLGTNNRVDLEGRIVKNDKGEEIFNFGKHKGKRVTQVFENEPSYYNWMLEGDFPGYTKKIIQRIKLNMLKNRFSGG